MWWDKNTFWVSGDEGQSVVLWYEKGLEICLQTLAALLLSLRPDRPFFSPGLLVPSQAHIIIFDGGWNLLISLLISEQRPYHILLPHFPVPLIHSLTQTPSHCWLHHFSLLCSHFCRVLGRFSQWWLLILPFSVRHGDGKGVDVFLDLFFYLQIL